MIKIIELIGGNPLLLFLFTAIWGYILFNLFGGTIKNVSLKGVLILIGKALIIFFGGSILLLGWVLIFSIVKSYHPSFPDWLIKPTMIIISFGIFFLVVHFFSE